MDRLITVNVNGETHHLSVRPEWTLLWVLREKLGLKGAKLGCNTGVCGACKVIVNRTAVASCRVLAHRVDGKTITTIEGLAWNSELHPLQEAFIRFGAFQCGFCVPGMIMETKAFLDKNPRPTEMDVRKALSHNICRCGSYAKQIAAIMEAAEIMRSEKGP